MIVKIKVNTSSKHTKVIEDKENVIVYAKSKPVDGAANKEVIELLAEYYSVPKSSVRIKNGNSSRYKLIEIIADR